MKLSYRIALSLAAAALALGVSFPSIADACRPHFDPELSPPRGSIPADQLRFSFDGTSSFAPLSESLRMYKVEGDVRTELALVSSESGSSRIVTFAEPPPPGTRVIAEIAAYTAGPPSEELSTEYLITEPHPLPSVLGSLTFTLHREALGVATASGQCATTVDAAYADFELVLSDAARPLGDAFEYTLVINDTPRPNLRAQPAPSWGLARGQGRIYTVCEALEAGYHAGLSAGSHRVRMRATLPNGASVETPDVEVSLNCDGDEPESWRNADEVRAAREGEGCSLSRGEPPTLLLVAGALALLTARSRRRVRRNSSL